MGVPYAEVIGDPITHSKSPLIHKFWLEKLGMEGDYRLARCTAAAMSQYLSLRCSDPYWRGCNVTAPLKQHAVGLVSDPTGVCSRIGAANAVFRSPLGCGIGANTDVRGVAGALDGPGTPGNRVCVIGAGGAARAALHYLESRGTLQCSLVVRDVEKGRRVQRAFRMIAGVYPFSACRAALNGAECVINATPLGMTGMPPMPSSILDLLPETDDHALAFDMVYSPVETDFLRRAREIGRNTADGIAMLIGQAAPAFELFFGAKAPREDDAELRELLTS